MIDSSKGLKKTAMNEKLRTYQKIIKIWVFDFSEVLEIGKIHQSYKEKGGRAIFKLSPILLKVRRVNKIEHMIVVTKKFNRQRKELWV